MPTLHGVSVSPFVRKVKVVLAEKAVEYKSELVVPMMITDEYRKKSPLGKIPCFEDGDFVVPDSSCIIAYLERAYPDTKIYPADAKDYARSLWYEEYADTAIRDVCVAFFFERLVKPIMLKQETDEERLKDITEKSMPKVFDYLEAEIGDREWMVGDQFSVADVAIGSPFVNFAHANESVDAARWPKLAAYVERILGRDSFKACLAEDQAFFAMSQGG